MIKGIIPLLFYIGFGLADTGKIKITILSTMVADYNYLGEWGFSALIESDGVKLLFDTSKVYATIGGFHLFNKNDKEIKWTSKFMKTYGVEYFLGAHCTGIDAVYSIRENNNLERSKCAVGSVGAYFDYKEGMFPGLITK